MRGTNIVLCRLASKALSQVGRAALPALLEHLRHRDPFVRGEAALALGWLGPAAAPAVQALREILRPEQFAQSSRPIDHYAATPPMLVTPPPAPTPDETCQAQAAQALGRIGPRGRVGAPGAPQVGDVQQRGRAAIRGAGGAIGEGLARVPVSEGDSRTPE